jgi:hypothetical protein
VRHRIRVAKATKIALVFLWVVLGLFVLADLSESARGDNFLLQAIPWDFAAGVFLSAVILAIDAAARFARRFAKPNPG